MANTKYRKKICSLHPELMGERWTSTRDCVGCTKERKAIYRKNNKENLSNKFKEWYLKNKESRSVYCKIWQEENKEYVKEQNKIICQKNKKQRNEYLAVWKKNNKDKINATAMTHSIIRKRLVGNQKIAKLYAKETAKIYKKCPIGFEVDHIIPLRGKTVNGLHVPWNLQYLSISDNRKKHNKLNWTSS